MSQATIKAPTIEFEPTAEQSAAIKHTGSDLLISAGAGSGKTATLTDRIVDRICNQGYDISRMLVVTYTKDAANELKTRIAKKLSQRLKDNPKSKHISEQIVRVTSADISTIHSFCLKCLRPYFDKLHLDSDFRIGEENELNILRYDAMNEVLDRFFEADSVDPDFLLVSDCYSEYTDDATLAQSLLTLYTNLSSCAEGLDILLRPVISGIDFLETPHGKVLVNRIRRAVEQFLPVIEKLYKEIAADEANNKYLDHFEELYSIYSRLANALENPRYETIKGIFDSYTAKRVKGGKSKQEPSVDVKLVNYIREDASDELKTLKATYFYSSNEAIFSTVVQNEKICHAIYKVLKEYENEYKSKKQRYALCDFNDLERYTLQLFYDQEGNTTDIAREISCRYDELYIDEYQDVNSVQDKIFKAISRNNRFMVGDIKQSIYGFRSAEPELFSAYRDSFVPYNSPTAHKNEGKTIFMSDNFRCDKNVIDIANHVSDHMFTLSRGFTYVEGDRLKCSKIHTGMHCDQKAELCIFDKSSIPEESFLNETDPHAEFVAQEIDRLLKNGKLPNGEKIEPKHIAILLKKSSGSIDKYINAMNKYGIKHEYVQEVSFFEKPCVLLLLCILNSIDNPSKDVYLTGAMHSHIWNFSLEELIKIKRSSPKEYSLYSALCSYEGELKDKVCVLLDVLNRYRQSVRKMSAEEAISFVLRDTGFLSSCNAEQRQDALKLYNIARGYEQGSYKGLYSFLRYIDNIAAERGINEMHSSDPGNSVKIMTMHKSKGLEFEICFLCDTEKEFSKRSYSAPLLFHRDLGICGYVSRPGGIVKYDNLLRKCTSLAIKDSELEEALRLLYVAMTRARSKLYITASVTKQAEKRERYAYLSDILKEYELYSCNNHLEIILGACPSPLEFLDIRVITADDIEEKAAGDSSTCQLDTEEAERIKAQLKERFEFKYEFEHLEKIPSKLSISSLYPEILDDQDNAEHTKSYSVEEIPSFILEKEKHISAADRGVATHVFMQFCDFEALQKHGYDKELARLVDNTFISKSVANLINKEHIEKFISSEIFKEFISAKSILREFRFNVMLDASEFSTDPMLKGEKVLVQGVTDCIYENNDGELILVDYKTDSVTPENYESVLKERHSSQLSYYKKACELMFDRPLSKVLIYSVPLAKTVEIK